VRRVYLDVCGTIPKIEELKHFVKDPNHYKRTKLIDKLLGATRGPIENTLGEQKSFERYGYDEQYARHWSMIWRDMLAAGTSSAAFLSTTVNSGNGSRSRWRPCARPLMRGLLHEFTS